MTVNLINTHLIVGLGDEFASQVAAKDLSY